jgi:hypothetical protein
MVAFEIYVDGEKLCTAGVGGTGVLTAITTWVNRGNPAQGQTDLRVGGLAHTQPGQGRAQVDWVHRLLQLGSEVRIRVIETGRVDEPGTTKAIDAADDLESERRYYEKLKKKFEG